MFGIRRSPYLPEDNGMLPVPKRDGVPSLDPLGKPTETPAPPIAPSAPVSLPKATLPKLFPSPMHANPPDPLPVVPSGLAAAPESDAALPKFKNRIQKLAWRGGIGGYESQGNEQAADEYNFLTNYGKINPEKITGKDRFVNALLTGLYGAFQGMAQTGDWRGAIGGGAAGAIGGAISPIAGREMMYEPRRQQMMQRKREDLQLQADETHAEALRAGLEGTRAKTRETIENMEIHKARTKSEIDDRAARLILEKDYKAGQTENQYAAAENQRAQAAYHGVQTGEKLAKLPGDLKKQEVGIILEQAKVREIERRIAESRAKLPWEIERIKAQVESEWAQALNLRTSAQSNQVTALGKLTEANLNDLPGDTVTEDVLDSAGKPIRGADGKAQTRQRSLSDEEYGQELETINTQRRALGYKPIFPAKRIANLAQKIGGDEKQVRKYLQENLGYEIR